MWRGVAPLLARSFTHRVERLAVLDIVPTDAAWDRADARFAVAFWPWSLLAQPEPLPEQILTRRPTRSSLTRIDRFQLLLYWCLVDAHVAWQQRLVLRLSSS
jgi:hypothetical protein